MSHLQPPPQSGAGDDRSTSNALLTNTRCCFCFPCFGSRPSPSDVGIAWWERVRSPSQSQPHDDPLTQDRWWSRGLRALMKLREWSEIVAGPRWKTFIRRFNRNRSGGGGGGKHGKYQYDPLSYSLNFDEGPGGQNADFEEGGYGYDGYRNFSTRYAAAAPAKSVSPSDSSPGKDVAVFA